MRWKKESSSVYYGKYVVNLSCCDMILSQFVNGGDWYLSANGLPISMLCLNTSDISEARLLAKSKLRFYLESRQGMIATTLKELGG